MQNQEPNSLPRVFPSSNISLTDLETSLIQRIFSDYSEIFLEKEFGGGFGGARVFLVLPVRANGVRDARVVTKIGPADSLRREFDNYQNYAGRAMPFTTAQVKEPCVQDGQAALNYVFVGDADLGKPLSLEDYYHTHSSEEVIRTLENLFGKALGPTWYGQSQPLTCRFQDEYGRHLPPHQELEEIVQKVFPQAVSSDGSRVTIPGVSGTFPNPLSVYPGLLDNILKGRKSFVHGDLHLQNVLVDESGKGWLIDFAKVRERHNLFDFIKLEVYIRIRALAKEHGAFSLSEYVQFEQALNNAALGQSVKVPSNPKLKFGYQVIWAVRELAGNYLADRRGFKQEYLPALFLYALAMMKYHLANGDVPTRLLFVTTCVCAQRLLEEEPMSQKEVKTESQNMAGSQEPSPGRKINTGGGAYIEGGVNTGGGDFVGRDQYNTMGLNSVDVARLFAIFYAAVEARANTSPSDKSDLKAELKEVEKEVAKGDDANETFLSRRLRNVGRMAPDILEVVLTTLAKPASGLALMVRKLAEKMKTEAGNGD